MKRTAPRKRNRSIEEYLWTDNDDRQDAFDDINYAWDDVDFVDDDDFYYYDLEAEA